MVSDEDSCLPCSTGDEKPEKIADDLRSLRPCALLDNNSGGATFCIHQQVMDRKWGTHALWFMYRNDMPFTGVMICKKIEAAGAIRR